MKLVRGTFGVMEIIDAIGYIIAFFVLLGLLLTGHIPHDMELWAGAGLGAMLLVVITMVIVQRRNRRNRRNKS